MQEELSIAPEKFDSQDVIDKYNSRTVSTYVYLVMTLRIERMRPMLSSVNSKGIRDQVHKPAFSGRLGLEADCAFSMLS